MRYLARFLLPIYILCSLLAAAPVAAQSDSYSLRWELYRDGGAADGSLLAVLWIDLAQGRHAYANPPGETGMPVNLRVSLDGGTRLPVVYPAGDAKPDAFDPSLTALIYEGPTPLFVRMGTPPADVGELSGTLSMAICTDENCQPVREQVALSLANVDRAALPDAQDFFWYQFHLADVSESATSTPQSLGARQPAPEASTSTPAVATTLLAESQGWDFSPQYFRPELEVTSLWPALGLAFIAGLILNFMPCVLPVVSLKLSALMAGATEEDTAKRTRTFREHNIFFSVGVLGYFLFLGGIVSALGLAWGQLFQSPGLIIALAGVVFALALSLFGVWNLPIIDLKAKTTDGDPRVQALFTGVLATLLATPCSGPFLGGVLGWVLLQPPGAILAVFLFIGLGMASPFLIMCARPGLVRLFPRPGAWMGHLEVGVGFFLMATVVYLLSIVPQAMLLTSLVLLLVIAFAAWMWGGWTNLSQPAVRRFSTRMAALAVVSVAVFMLFGGGPAPAKWADFSPAALRANLGERPVLVDFTADWCPNCKLLEHTALAPDNLARWRDEYGLELIQVDMTRENPEALELLRALGSQSIPVVAIFPPGEKARSPLVLRDLFTTDQMDKALERSLRN